MLPRPPWYPEDGPVEYIFNQVDNHLKYIGRDRVRTVDDLIPAIRAGVAAVRGIGATFLHCGY